MLKHENVVKLIEAFRRKEKLYLVFEYVDHSLLEIIEKYPSGIPVLFFLFKTFSKEDTIKLYIFQMLKAISFLHDMEIIHRDIKPENLLVDLQDNLKLCDFGFARALNPKGGSMTHYVATRWYRSPELLITANYGRAVDIWAIGCIMAEMIDGNPLFPGDDLIDQLDTIQTVLGDVPMGLKALMIENVELQNMKLRHISNPETLEKRYRGKISLKGMKLMKALLIMDPSKRPTAKQALEFSYFDCFRSRRLTSPGVNNQRVLSSTYRNTKYKLFDNRNSSTDKRAPSYSQGRRRKKYKKGRSESRGGKNKGDFLNLGRHSGSFKMNSTMNHGFHQEKKRKRGKKPKNQTRKEFAIYTQTHFNKSRRDDRESGFMIGIETPDAGSRRKKNGRNGIKKSKHNFKMFRIKEESGYKSRGNVKRKGRSKKKKKIKKDEEQENLNGNFLPYIHHGGQTKKDLSGSNLSFYSRSMHYSKGNLASDSKSSVNKYYHKMREGSPGMLIKMSKI